MAIKAYSVSDLQGAISSAGNGDVIEIPAGANWEISIPSEEYSAFPTITKDITITTDSNAERTVLTLPNNSEFCFFEVASGGMLTLRNITFKDSLGSEASTLGAHIEFNGTSLILDNCSFEDNIVDRDLIAIGTHLSNSVETVSILNCVFQNNEISNGGVLRDWNPGVTDLIYIKNSVLMNNKATNLLFPDSDIFLMVNTQFWGNDTKTLGNGFTCVGGSTNVSIIGCGFFGNVSGVDILNMGADSVLSIKECWFVLNIANSSPADGTLFVNANELTVESCYFESNSGGIIIGGRGEFRDCYFAGNDCRLNALIVHKDGGSNCANPAVSMVVRNSRFGQNIGPLVYAKCTAVDIRFNWWEIPPDASRFVERDGGQIIYDGPINPPAPCSQSGGQVCCVPALA